MIELLISSSRKTNRSYQREKIPVSRNAVPERFARFVNLTVSMLAAVFAFGAIAANAGMVIGPGASVSTGFGQIELGCGDAEIAGGLSGSLTGARNVSFHAGAVSAGALLSLSGNWVNEGPAAIDAMVEWPDGCGVTDSSMLGSSVLRSLTVTSQIGRAIHLDINGEQRIGNSLILTGAPGMPVRLRSTDAGSFAQLSLDPGASQLIDSVDVANLDSNAGQRIAPGRPIDFNSVQSGPVRNWFMLPAVPVPTLGTTAMALLILLIIMLGFFYQRRHPSSIPE